MHLLHSLSNRNDLIWYSMAILLGGLVVVLVNMADTADSLDASQASHEIMMKIDMATAQLIEWQLRQL